MEKGQAEHLARTLMAQHLDAGWRFEWDNAKQRLGACHFIAKKITLSLPNTLRSDERSVRDTVLHEVAHAIAGPGAGHGRDWKRVAVRLGANPSASTSDGPDLRAETAPWVGTCPAGHVSPKRYFRKPRANYSCSQCAPVWKAENVITYRKVAVTAGVR
jgi:SprT protein